MRHNPAVERFFTSLISGNRSEARLLVNQLRHRGMTAEAMVSNLFWPTLEQIQNLYREDMLSDLAHHFATRCLRTLVDQNQTLLTRSASLHKSALVICGPEESEEIGAQLTADLLEARGFDVLFPGGGIPNDELISQVREARPSLLVIFGAVPSTLPFTRLLIDGLHDEGLLPATQIAVGGGVFNRAEGLAEEMGADLIGTDPGSLVDLAVTQPDRRSHFAQRTVGRRLQRRNVA